MGDLVAIRNRAIALASDACALDRDKKYQEAFDKYYESIKQFNHVIKCIKKLSLDEKNPTLQATLKSKAEEYLSRAMEIKKYLKSKEDPQPVAAGPGDVPKSGGKG